MTLSTIIEKKKEEFDEKFESFIEYPVNDRPILAPCEYEDIVEMKGTLESFIEKSIRESVEDALREVQISSDTVIALSTKYYPDTDKDFTTRHRALAFVGDVIGRIEDKVKEFMK